MAPLIYMEEDLLIHQGFLLIQDIMFWENLKVLKLELIPIWV